MWVGEMQLMAIGSWSQKGRFGSGVRPSRAECHVGIGLGDQGTEPRA